jgi:outer membrane protein assembly factor BamB
MKHLSIILPLVLFPTLLSAQEAQFRGPDRNGIYQESGLLKIWPETGPERLLTVEGIGLGYSSAVISDGTIYVTGMKNRTDILSAVSLEGKILWQVPYGESWTQSFPDTRTTPTVEETRIYVISGMGRVGCFSTNDGKEIWAVDMDKDFESDWHSWGVAESPLLVDNMVICCPAGKKATVVAFDKMTGQLVWQSKIVDGKQSYASPVLYKWNNQRFILASTTENLIAVDPGKGDILWTYRHWLPDREPKAGDDLGQIFTNCPVYQGDMIYLTRGYNYPSVMVQVAPDGKSVTEKWIDKNLDNHHHGVVVLEGFIYGSNWINNGRGNWVCLDWQTGSLEWETTWNNKGPVILADGLLYIMDEKGGNVGLVDPDPAGFKLVSTFKPTLGTGPWWPHPSIHGGKLLIRHGDVLMVYDIKSKS